MLHHLAQHEIEHRDGLGATVMLLRGSRDDGARRAMTLRGGDDAALRAPAGGGPFGG